MSVIITISNNVNNVSLQLGDMAYYVENAVLEGEINSTPDIPVLIGEIIDIDGSDIEVDGSSPPIGAFLMFSKNKIINDSNLIGYFSRIKLVNNDTNYAEIYKISSEISVSSK